MIQVTILIDFDDEGASFIRGPGVPPELTGYPPATQLRKMLLSAVADVEAWIEKQAPISAEGLRMLAEKPRDE